jgi:ribosomal protein L44E
VEALRSKLIVERHEREKEQNDYGVMIRWDAFLQKDRKPTEKLILKLSLYDCQENWTDCFIPGFNFI